MAAEPTVAALPSPLAQYFLATRPAFLSVTLFAVLIGLAAAWHGGVQIRLAPAVATLVFALVAHAGINVLNDYYDALSGTDAANTGRIFPYTGGSRFIQNGVLTERETATFGAALLAVVAVAGLWLAAISHPGLLVIGAAGLAIGWAYSAPPLKLASRGLGEPCVWIGFALLAVGSDFVQRGAFSGAALLAAAPYALLVTNLLFINEFPDRQADELAGKRHWVVRLGARRARWLYAGLAAAAYTLLIGAVAAGTLPSTALIALAAALPSSFAARALLRHAGQPSRLAPAIRATIGAACLHGALLAGALFASGH